MAQMKNKINETNKYPQHVFRECGHDKSAPTVGARGYTLVCVNNPQRTFRRRRVRFIVPVRTELYNCTHVFKTILTSYGERMHNIYYFFSYCLWFLDIIITFATELSQI